MIQKGDGGYGYGTTDMAAITNRVRTEKADWSIYVTDEGQAWLPIHVIMPGFTDTSPVHS